MSLIRPFFGLVVALWLSSVAAAQDVRSVAAGNGFTCALLADSTVRCWGNGEHGQIGDGTTDTAWRPTPVRGLRGVTDVAVGDAHACALLEDTTVRCWGANGEGQLGDGTDAERTEPVVVSALRDVVSIAAGGAHSCAALRDGSVRCWGSNALGQIGSGVPWGLSETRTTPTSEGPMRLAQRSLVPVRVPGVSRVDRVVLGRERSCAFRRVARAGAPRHSAVRCWGAILAGSRDFGPTARPLPPSVHVDRLGLGADGYTCAIQPDRSVVCSGQPWSAARRGEDSPSALAAPTLLAGARDVIQIAMGRAHACLLDAAGHVRCWGHNYEGQLADGSVPRRTEPTPVVGLASAVELAVGGRHTCARLRDATVRCWGDNGFHQIDEGASTDRIVPTPIAGLTGVVALAAGANHTCARLSDGTARCWGWNERAQLGDGSHVERGAPVVVRGLAGIAQLGCGSEHTCARLNDGTVRCWGRNEHAQLGDGTHRDRAAPVPVRGLADAVDLSVGAVRSCARRRDGSMRCWGFSGPARREPVSALTIGGAYECALDRDGSTVRCESAMPNGRWAPAATLRLASVTQVVAGSQHACALVAGRVHCAGRNAHGELGDGTTRSRASFAVIAGLTDVAHLAAGAYQTCATRRDGTALCWGANESSQLGDGSAAFRAAPTEVRW